MAPNVTFDVNEDNCTRLPDLGERIEDWDVDGNLALPQQLVATLTSLPTRGTLHSDPSCTSAPLPTAGAVVIARTRMCAAI